MARRRIRCAVVIAPVPRGGVTHLFGQLYGAEIIISYLHVVIEIENVIK